MVPFVTTCVLNQLKHAFGHGEADDVKTNCRAKIWTKRRFDEEGLTFGITHDSFLTSLRWKFNPYQLV